MNAMKQRTNKTNQNNRWEKEKNTRTNIHTRKRAYTLKGDEPSNDNKNQRNTDLFIYIYIYIKNRM